MYTLHREQIDLGGKMQWKYDDNNKQVRRSLYRSLGSAWFTIIIRKYLYSDINVWLSRIEAKSECFMKILWANDKEEFISSKLRSFCKKQTITIKYMIPYIHAEENELTQWDLRTIVIMKDSILINSGLLNSFLVETIKIKNYLWNQLPTMSKNMKRWYHKSFGQGNDKISNIFVFLVALHWATS